MAAFEMREESTEIARNQLDPSWCEGAYICILTSFTYPAASVTLDIYSIFPERGEGDTIYSWFQYFTPEGLDQSLAVAGFGVADKFEDVAGWAFSGPGAELEVTANKPDG